MKSTRSLVFLILSGVALVACGSHDDSMGTTDEAEEELRARGGGGGDPVDPPPTTMCYLDADGDGLGGASGRRFAGGCPAGYTTRRGDCDDHNAAVLLGNSCFRDADGDGFAGTFSAYSCGACPAGTSATQDDCNDGDGNVHPRSCGVDADHDGFAASTTMCVASCPSVTSDGNDCNDANGSIHELTTELAGNGVDENCNGLVDEAIFDYAENASLASAHSVHLSFHVQSPAVLARVAARSGPLYAKVKYRKLTNTSAPTSVVLPWLPAPSSSGTTGEIELTGLDPSTLYLISLQFLDENQGATFPAAGNDRDGEPTHSEEYFTTTTAEGGDRLAQVRPLIVLKTFYNRMRFERGWVSNGNDYCSYSCDSDHGGDAWCSEYYDSMIDAWLKDVSVPFPLHMQASNVVDYFQSYGSYSDVNVPYMLANFGHAGDYIAMGDNNTIHHSAMFLAYDQGTNSYWHIDGNSGARVRIGQDWQPTHYYGVGYLAAGMLR